jgi:streptogramin lyase
MNRAPAGNWKRRSAGLGLWLAGLGAAVAASSGWSIATVAGTGDAGFSGDGGPARRARINEPFGVVRGPDGALWFCEYTGQRIRRITRDGSMETVAGTGERAYRGDGGPARDAAFNRPHEIRFDRAGNCYIADMANHAIRRIDARTGVISTFAGTGIKGYSGDGGPAAAATLSSPHSIQFSPEGDLYICDIGNHVIRRVERDTGRIATYAGTGRPGPTPDGAPLAGTPLRGPRSLDFDAAGNLWLATREGNQVFRFDRRAGVIHHVAGSGKAGFTGHGGPAREATLSGPKGIAIDREGNVWLADTESHSVRMIDPRRGTIEWIAGTGAKGNGGDGDARACALARLHGIFADADGAIYIGDSEAHRVRVLRRMGDAAK